MVQMYFSFLIKLVFAFWIYDLIILKVIFFFQLSRYLFITTINLIENDNKHHLILIISYKIGKGFFYEIKKKLLYIHV